MNEIKTPRPRWEYLTVRREHENPCSDAVLNGYGDAGWELVSASWVGGYDPCSARHVYVFKRELTP